MRRKQKKLTLKEAQQRIAALEDVTFNLRETLWKVEAAVVELGANKQLYRYLQQAYSSEQQGPPLRGSKLRKRGLGKKA